MGRLCTDRNGKTIWGAITVLVRTRMQRVRQSREVRH